MNVVDNFADDVDQKVGIWEFGDLLYRAARYKSLPYILKNNFYYDTYDFSNIIKSDNLLMDDYTFYGKLKNQKLSYDELAGKSFKIYHLRGAHPAFDMNEYVVKSEDATIYTQGMGSLKIVYEYLEQMKDLGLYDDATIIITADHGQNFNDGYRQNELSALNMSKCSNPILFIKEPSSNKDKAMDISHKEITQLNLIQSISDYCEYGINKVSVGIDDVGDTEHVERCMIYRRSKDIPFQKYVVNGYVKDFSNWQLIE